LQVSCPPQMREGREIATERRSERRKRERVRKTRQKRARDYAFKLGDRALT